MKKNSLFLTLFLIFCFSTITFSQESQKKVEISPEKKQIIAEIITITEADKQAEQSTKDLMNEMGRLYPGIVDSVLKDYEDISDAEKAKLRKEMLAKQETFNKRFQTRYFELISFKDLIDQTIYPVYDQLFTEQELKDLLEFYKSPTGKKFINVSPQLGREIINRTTTYLLPKIEEIMLEITKEGL